MKIITLSGVIGWDATPDQLRRGLEEASGGDVQIVISSPGGYVADALEMYNLIRNYAGKTTAILSGYAMSAASYIPLAADEVLAEDNAAYMIHNAQGCAYGDHNEMLKYGTVLQGMSKMLGRAYENFTGKSEGDIKTMMDDETYFFGESIVEAGFAHGLIPMPDDTEGDEEVVTASARIAFDAMAQKMGVDPKKVKADLDKAATMIASEIKKHTEKAQVAPPTKSTKDKTMDLITLREKHQDLVVAIETAATAGMVTKIEAATLDGAATERARIEGVRAQLIPGHEEIIATMELDGKSTGADAAMAIVAAEKVQRAAQLNLQESEANDLVDNVEDVGAGGGKKTMKRAEYDKLDPTAQSAYMAGGGVLAN